MSEALVFHINSAGRILHMECLGGMKPLLPKGYCLVRTLGEIMPKEVSEKAMKEIKGTLMNKNNYTFFMYKLEGDNYSTRMAYLRDNVVLVVIQKESHSPETGGSDGI